MRIDPETNHAEREAEIRLAFGELRAAAASRTMDARVFDTISHLELPRERGEFREIRGGQ